MPEETSYQRHVGPWPIKRSQSVPDTSLFTPRNSPPFLTSLLANVEEDCKECETALHSYGANDLENTWSGYPMKQSRSNIDKDADVVRKTTFKKHDQLGAERWMLQAAVLFGSCITIFMPYCIVGVLGQLDASHTTAQQQEWLIRSIYCWLYFLATASSFVASVAVVSLDMIVHKKVVNSETLGGMLMWAFLIWMVMSIGWIFVVLV